MCLNENTFKKISNSLNMTLTLRVFSQCKIDVLDFSDLGNLKSYSVKMEVLNQILVLLTM